MRPASFFYFRCLPAVGALFLLGVGCRSIPRPVAGPAAHRPAPIRVGEIAVVDEEKHFVLIDLESNLYVPAPGTKLSARNAAGEVAHLQASSEQKRPFIAADIVDGEPAVGDEVVR